MLKKMAEDPAEMDKNPHNTPAHTLSAHLFWDVDKTAVEWEKNAPFLIGRVLEYGLMADWEMIQKQYGLAFIKEKVVELRTIDDVTLAFLCLIFDLQPADFRCYKLKQLGHNFWNY